MPRIVPLRRVAAVALTCLSISVAAQGPDDLWEVTTKMEMAGMPAGMPAMTQKVCSPKSREDDRMVPMDKNCRMLESKRSGSRFTFKFRCEGGGNDYAGTGDMEYQGKDAYTGKMTAKGKMEGEPVDMAAQWTGKRVGNCTYEDPQKKADKAMAQMNAEIAKTCDKVVDELATPMVVGDAAICKDRKADFCANVTKVTSTMRDPKGFREGQSKYDTRWRDAAQACGIDPASISGPVCRSAIDGKDWNFVSSSCPAEAAALRKENCAGRTYTSVAANFREMCSTLGGLSYTADRADAAKAAPAGGESAPAEPKKKGATEMLKEGAGKLKKFLKF